MVVKAIPRKHSSMEIDSGPEPSIRDKAEAYRARMDPLATSLSKVSGSLRGIPSNEDYHFYHNFDEFKAPVNEIAEKSKSMLKTIGSSMNPLGKVMPFPDDSDEAYEWLVDRNDEAFEQFDASVDEFKRVRGKEEESGKKVSVFMEEDGFQLVNRKNKKIANYDVEKDEGQNSSGVVSLSSVTMAFKDKKTTGAKPSVPFHIPTIPRPQDEFRIVVNNANKPFEHVWLQKSEDGSKFIHPLEKLSDADFVDRNIGEGEPVKPPPIESTPFTLVEDVKELKALAAKLRDVNEFAVDLEHNNYRSFQGLTCLMQISTRTEDFVVDTLKLRVHIGPYLREVFKDPSKRKVLHGADHDIKWLQRDFGIYVCNMFDTGQASRLLELERNSLEYLLRHFCGVTANKEYQNADWRIRPIPDEMLRYAREDTHYLLHIYDLMKRRLISASNEGEDLLLEVYKLSRVICMLLYKKDILTETTYLHIYGLAAADFNSQQLAIVAGLCEWRDLVGRLEDESTGYILPNRTLLEIARQVPLTAAKLRRIVKSKHPHIERNLGAVVSVIRNSVQNADAFVGAVAQLKERAEEVLKQSMEVVTDEFEALAVPGDPIDIQAVATQQETINGEDYIMENGNEHEAASAQTKEALGPGDSLVQQGTCAQGRSFGVSGGSVDQNKEQGSNVSELLSGSTGVMNVMGATCLTKNAPEATVQVLKKPNRAFGALLGNMGSKRKLDPNSRDKSELKVEQIKSSVTLPFHSFVCSNEQSKPPTEESAKAMELPVSREAEFMTNLEEVIPLDGDASNHESSDEDPSTANGELDQRVNGSSAGAESNADDEMSDLYAGFQSLNSEKKNRRRAKVSQEPDDYPELEPYDYGTAREQVKFGKVRGESTVAEAEEDFKSPKGGSKERRKKPASARLPTEEVTSEFQQARRRQAFPQSGNRSSTFR